MNWAITGYYGFGNLGDDLMLYLLVERISLFDPNARFTILIPASGDPACIELPPNSSASVRQSGNLRDLVSVIRQIDVLIFGGGTCLHRRGFCSLYACILARAMRKSVYWLGVGAEDVGLGLPRKKAKIALRMCSGITFRDERSAAVARELHPAIKNIRITADLAYLARLSPSLGFADNADEDADETILLVSWRDFSGYVQDRVRDDVIRNAGEWIVKFAAECRYKEIVIANMADLIDREANWQLYTRICEILEASSGISVRLVEKLSLREKIRLIRRSGLFVSARLHGFFLGKLMDRPAVGIAYAQKVASFAETLTEARIVTLESLIYQPSLLSTIATEEVSAPAQFRDREGELRRALENVAFLQHDTVG